MKNEMDQDAIDILLASYFAGEADAAERAQVENWIASSENNKAYFDASKKAWDTSAVLLADQQFNTDAAWRKVHARMNEQHDGKPSRKGRYMWMAAAGVALFITVVSLLLIDKSSTGNEWQVTVATAAETKNDTLPDASVVSLNRNSSIEYASAFDGEIRQVNLSGEAFFDVTRNEQQPFVIKAGLMDIKVLGTSFNVRAYPGEDSVHVSVETGKVQCVANGDTVIITPGQYAVYDKGSGKIRFGKEDDPNRSAYRNRIFRFSDTPLASMVQQLNAAYGCKIILNNDAIKSCRFSSTKVFNNEPVGNIIEAIKVTFPNITSKDNGDTIILDGTSCN